VGLPRHLVTAAVDMQLEAAEHPQAHLVRGPQPALRRRVARGRSSDDGRCGGHVASSPPDVPGAVSTPIF
jgi:hypothetical protein